jgi:hypothetical protein
MTLRRSVRRKILWEFFYQKLGAPNKVTWDRVDALVATMGLGHLEQDNIGHLKPPAWRPNKVSTQRTRSLPEKY